MAPSPSQAIQSRDHIQLQYSQSLIEKDQYRKQVRSLEAERDELLTTLTSLEGTKALLEAQLQRAQGGPCLKVMGRRSTGSWVACWGPGRSFWPGVGPGGRPRLRVGSWGNWQEPSAGSGACRIDGSLQRWWDDMGPPGNAQLGLRRCRFWEGMCGSWLEPSRGSRTCWLGESSWPGGGICWSGGGPQLGWVWVGE